jgi:hypothetical protein
LVKVNVHWNVEPVAEVFAHITLELSMVMHGGKGGGTLAQSNFIESMHRVPSAPYQVKTTVIGGLVRVVRQRISPSVVPVGMLPPGGVHVPIIPVLLVPHPESPVVPTPEIITKGSVTSAESEV